jgi:hypothetical protein
MVARAVAGSRLVAAAAACGASPEGAALARLGAVFGAGVSVAWGVAWASALPVRATANADIAAAQSKSVRSEAVRRCTIGLAIGTQGSSSAAAKRGSRNYHNPGLRHFQDVVTSLVLCGKRKKPQIDQCGWHSGATAIRLPGSAFPRSSATAKRLLPMLFKFFDLLNLSRKLLQFFEKILRLIGGHSGNCAGHLCDGLKMGI